MATQTNETIDILLKTHRDNDTVDYDEIWSKGTFIFDANVLLDIYRLPESARNDLIKVLSHKDFKQRIWIAQQVLIEFLYNRIEVINDQKVKYGAVREILEDCKIEYADIFKKLSTALDKLKLKKKHSSINPDEFLTKENIDNGIKFIDDFTKKLNELEEKQSDVHSHDQIKPIILNLFKGKIGEGIKAVELGEIYKEGERRYKKQIPPGYKDEGKEGFYMVGDKEYIRKYGDLLLWQEIIEKAQTDNLKHVILITGDLKEDWWLKKSGKTLGPRKELLNEIYCKAPKLENFYLYETSTFLARARDKLNINVKESTITETKNLSRVQRVKYEVKSTERRDYIDLKTAIELCSTEALREQLHISKTIELLPEFEVNLEIFITAISEILHNIEVHSAKNTCAVHARLSPNNVIVTFKNRKRTTPTPISEDELFDRIGPAIGEGRTGLAKVYNSLRSQGINMRIISSTKSFTLKLYIPRTSFASDPSGTDSESL